MKNETAKNIVKKIVEDLCDRLGLQNEWDNIDKDTQKEIIKCWEKIASKEIRSGESEALDEYAKESDGLAKEELIDMLEETAQKLTENLESLKEEIESVKTL